MNIKYSDGNLSRVNSSGLYDFVSSDGVLVKDVTRKPVLVRSSSDLQELADKYDPGTIFYTAGFASMWELDASGAFVPVGG